MPLEGDVAPGGPTALDCDGILNIGSDEAMEQYLRNAYGNNTIKVGFDTQLNYNSRARVKLFFQTKIVEFATPAKRKM